MIPKEQAHLAVAALSHAGMSGKNNEDRYAVHAYTLSAEDPTPSLFAIVADGIGGHLAGEVAAEIVVETISEAVAQSDGHDPLGVLREASPARGKISTARQKASPPKKAWGRRAPVLGSSALDCTPPPWAIRASISYAKGESGKSPLTIPGFRKRSTTASSRQTKYEATRGRMLFTAT